MMHPLLPSGLQPSLEMITIQRDDCELKMLLYFKGFLTSKRGVNSHESNYLHLSITRSPDVKFSMFFVTNRVNCFEFLHHLPADFSALYED